MGEVRAGWGTWACCFIALTADVFGTWLTNVFLYPHYLAIFPEARDVSSAVGIATLVVLAVWAQSRPASIKEPTLTAVGLSLYSIGFVLILVGLWQSSAASLAVGSAVRSVGSRWFVVLAGLALCRLEGRRCMLCIAAAFAASYLLRVPFVEAGGRVAVPTLFLLGFLTCLAARRPALAALSALSGAEPARDAAITQPSSYVPFAHALFAAILLFRVAYGFALTFEATGGVPQTSMLGLVPIALLLLLAFLPHLPRADILYQASALLVMAGFLAIIVLSGRADYGSTVNGLLFCGSECFEVLMWFALAAVGARNPSNALAVFAWGRAASSFGLLVGATVGHWTAELASGLEISALVAVVLFLFVAVNLTVLKDFSFQGTIDGVAAPRPLRLVAIGGVERGTTEDAEDVEGAADAARGGVPGGAGKAAERVAADNAAEGDVGRTREAGVSASGAGTASSEGADPLAAPCATVAEEFRLTPRETEILAMLAHGRNAPYIQERLVLSRNTVKTHVQNIYAKLAVHSQQELIDVVEDYGR